MHSATTMITPYPPPIAALEPCRINPLDLDPIEAMNILQRKVNEVTGVVNNFVQFQAPLAECIMELQKKHAEEMKVAQTTVDDLFSHLKTLRSRFKETEKRVKRLQRIVASDDPKANREAPPVTPAGPAFVPEDVAPILPATPVVPLPPFPSISSSTHEPSMLSMKIDFAETSLNGLIDTINNKNRLPSSERTSRHGCFQGLATNCFIVRQWELSQQSMGLLRLYAGIEKNQMLSSKVANVAADEVAVLERLCEEKGLVGEESSSPKARNSTGDTSKKPITPSPSSQSRSLSPRDPDASEIPDTKPLIDLMQPGITVTQEELDTPRNFYTFTLSAQLKDAKPVDELMREEAIEILRGLPLTVSFSTAPGEDNAQCRAPDFDTERRILLDRDPETNAWAVRERSLSEKAQYDSVGPLGSTCAAAARYAVPTSGDAADREDAGKPDRKGKGRMYPSTFVPSVGTTLSPLVLGGSDAEDETDLQAGHPSMEEKVKASAVSSVTSPLGANGAAARLVRATRRRTARQAETELPTSTGEGDKGPADSDAAVDVQAETKPKRSQTVKIRAKKATTAVASVEESPVPIRPVNKRGRQVANTEVADTEAIMNKEQADASRPTKKRKLQARK